jgi:hypothetical protein
MFPSLKRKKAFLRLRFRLGKTSASLTRHEDKGVESRENQSEDDTGDRANSTGLRLGFAARVHPAFAHAFQITVGHHPGENAHRNADTGAESERTKGESADDHGGVAQAENQRAAVRFIITADQIGGLPPRRSRAIFRLKFLTAMRTSQISPSDASGTTGTKGTALVLGRIFVLGKGRTVEPRERRCRALGGLRSGLSRYGDKRVLAAKAAHAPSQQSVGHLNATATGRTGQQFHDAEPRQPSSKPRECTENLEFIALRVACIGVREIEQPAVPARASLAGAAGW